MFNPIKEDFGNTSFFVTDVDLKWDDFFSKKSTNSYWF